MRLSSNLAHLLAVKERQICCLRSVPDDAKERTIIALTRLRYLVGKAMVRKVVLGKRGATVFSSLESHLNGPSSPIDDAPLEMRMGPIGRKTAPKPKALQWDLKQIEESFIVLRDDLEMQRALDEALREGILGPVRNFRYYRMAVQEQVQMRQFGQFMEEELARFQVLYARWDKGLTIVDRVLGGNHD